MHIHLGLEGFAGTVLWAAELIVFLLSVFWRPQVGLYLLIPMLPLQTMRYRIHGYFLGDQFIDLLVLGVIIGLKRTGQPILQKTPLNVVLFAYALYTYLSLFRGSSFLDIDFPLLPSDRRLADWKNYVLTLPLIFLITTAAIRTKRQMAVLLICMGLGCLALAKGYANTIRDRDFSTFSYDVRDAGAMGTAGVNGFAAFAAQTSLFFTGAYLCAQGIPARLACFLPVPALLYCLLFALSRGGYASFLGGIIYLGIVRSRVLLLGLVIFLGFWQGLVPQAVRERIYMTTDADGQIEHSAAARMSLWEEAMRVFEADPVFGTGFNTYAYGSHHEGFGDTHNLYVKVLVETGIVGLVLFLAMLLRLFRIGVVLQKTATDPFLRSIGYGFSALMTAVLLGNLFGDRWMYFQITGYTFAFAGLAYRAQQMTDDTEGEDNVEALLQPAETVAPV